MNKNEITKFAGALIVGVLVVIVSVVISKVFYQQSEFPEKSSYFIEAAEAKPAVSNNKSVSDKSIVAKVEDVKIDIASIISSGNADNGGKLIKKKCVFCHKFTASGGKAMGPNLFGVAGRNIAFVDGYKYSAAMKAKGGKWNDKSLFEFLTKPSAFIPKTKMGFAGFKKSSDIADVISYLKTLK